ncbi:craniofacial development protein 2-like [Plakobranchus ocellatus]|uniref:Craniofacial development protein 2-like n=1 Tax=Plakobranchus ocellatus TaxID=259542 RepID=A0AAV4DFS7_9GAST|nr:craniofacial development protein 2-like [Plakobranchus ocellatus]
MSNDVELTGGRGQVSTEYGESNDVELTGGRGQVSTEYGEYNDVELTGGRGQVSTEYGESNDVELTGGQGQVSTEYGETNDVELTGGRGQGGHTHERGVGILFDVTMAKSLGSWCPISDRVVVAKLVAKPLNLGIIQIYAPTSDSEDIKVEKFYEEIEKAKGYLNFQDIIIIMGDFNAKIGDERLEDVDGPSGIGTVNERESRLIEWCQVNDFTITNA